MLIVIIILTISIVVKWIRPKRDKENDSLRKNLDRLNKLEYNKIKQELDYGRK